MTLALFEHGAQRLDAIVRPGVLCAFDFDGTLAPLMAQPQRVRLPGHVRRRLRALAELAPVAVITGRALADIRARLRFAPDFLIGNHGLEGLAGAEADARRYRAICRVWRTALARVGRLDPRIFLEDKQYSLSLHYRLARDPGAAGRRLHALCAMLRPAPRVVTGKYVLNLLPPGAPDKGVALARLMQVSGARGAIYIGDDVTDEDVFRLPRRDLLSVRVGAEAASAAEFFLHDRLEMTRLLDELIGRLGQWKGSSAYDDNT